MYYLSVSVQFNRFSAFLDADSAAKRRKKAKEDTN